MIELEKDTMLMLKIEFVAAKISFWDALKIRIAGPAAQKLIDSIQHRFEEKAKSK